MAKGIYKRGNVYWIRYAGFDGKVVRESSKTTKFKEAEDLLIKRKKAIRDGNEPEPIKRIINYTFSQLAEEYLKWCQRQRSYRSKKGFLEQLTEKFGDLQLRKFNTQLIEQFQSERLQEGKQKVKINENEWKYLPNKPATVNRLIATLKHCINKGYQWEMLSEQTFKRIKQVTVLEENNGRLRYLAKEECKELVNSSESHLKPIITTALNTGMRKGEILNLKWDENVDLKHGFILLGLTKNGDRREIPINDTLRSTLKGITRRIDIPYVFHNQKTGKPFTDVKRGFKTAVRRAKIHDFKFHDLRHTFASHLVMAGVDITTVSRLLGHKSLTMTLRYAHLAPSHMVNAVNVLDTTLTGKPTAQKLHISKEKELTVNG